MASQKRFAEIFNYVNKIEESLEYAHVDSAEPSKDSFLIGSELNEEELPIPPPIEPTSNQTSSSQTT